MAPDDEQNNVPELCASTPWFKFRARGYDVLVTLWAKLKQSAEAQIASEQRREAPPPLLRVGIKFQFTS